VVRNVGPKDLTLSLAALMHDLGKTRTRIIDDGGKTRFFGHETVGATLAREWLESMRFSGETVENVALLVKNHMRFTGLSHLSPSAARRLIRDMGDQLDRLLALVEADANALKPGVRGLDLGPIRAQIAETLRETPRETLVSPLNGNEISSLTGIETGPEIGQIKRRLTEMVLSGEIKAGDKEAAKSWVLSTFATQDGATTSSIDKDQAPS
jgi:poly(A) polymerase